MYTFRFGPYHFPCPNRTTKDEGLEIKKLLVKVLYRILETIVSRCHFDKYPCRGQMARDYVVHTEINCKVSLIHCGLVWHMVSEIVAITGSSNGFSPIYCKVIAWISSDL